MARIFDSRNWFPIHNACFDKVMPTLSGAAWRVLCVAIRQTLGWADTEADPTGRTRKEWDTISYSQFMEKAGIRSTSTIKLAIDELCGRGYLLRRPAGIVPGTGAILYEYALNLDYDDEAGAEIEAAKRRSENRSGTAAKIEAAPLRKSKRQNKETNKQSDDDDETSSCTQSELAQKEPPETADAVAALLARGWNAGDDAAWRFVAKHGADKVLSCCRHAARHNLGAGWVYENAATWRPNGRDPDGATQAEHTDVAERARAFGVCPVCCQSPCDLDYHAEVARRAEAAQAITGAPVPDQEAAH